MSECTAIGLGASKFCDGIVVGGARCLLSLCAPSSMPSQLSNLFDPARKDSFDLQFMRRSVQKLIKSK